MWTDWYYARFTHKNLSQNHVWHNYTEYIHRLLFLLLLLLLSERYLKKTKKKTKHSTHTFQTRAKIMSLHSEFLPSAHQHRESASNASSYTHLADGPVHHGTAETKTCTVLLKRAGHLILHTFSILFGSHWAVLILWDCCWNVAVWTQKGQRDINHSSIIPYLARTYLHIIHIFWYRRN